MIAIDNFYSDTLLEDWIDRIQKKNIVLGEESQIPVTVSEQSDLIHLATARIFPHAFFCWPTDSAKCLQISNQNFSETENTFILMLGKTRFLKFLSDFVNNQTPVSSSFFPRLKAECAQFESNFYFSDFPADLRHNILCTPVSTYWGSLENSTDWALINRQLSS